MFPAEAEPAAEGFAAALSRAIKRRGVTLGTLAEQLRDAGYSVSIATLSYWQTGRSLPTRTNSVKAVAVLEGLLDVRPGQLTRLLPGKVAQPWNPMLELAQDPELAAVLTELDLMPTERPAYATRFVDQSARVSADGLRHHEGIRQIIRCDADQLRHVPLVFQIHDDASGQVPQVTALGGCRIGAIRQLPGGLTIVEFVLNHPLQRGELTMLEYGIDWLVPYDTDHAMSRGIPDGVDYMCQSVRFEGPLPSSIRYFEVAQDVVMDVEEDRLEDPLVPAPFVQRVASSPTAGSLGLAWSK